MKHPGSQELSHPPHRYSCNVLVYKKVYAVATAFIRIRAGRNLSYVRPHALRMALGSKDERNANCGFADLPPSIRRHF